MPDWLFGHYRAAALLGAVGLLAVGSLTAIRSANGPIEPDTGAQGWYVFLAVVVCCAGGLVAVFGNRRKL